MTGSTSTQKTSSEPWKAAQPALLQMLNSGMSLYNSGVGFNPYPGSTVAGLSDQTTQALQGMTDLAQNGNPLGQSAYNNAQGVIDTGGLSADQRAALGSTYGVATGANGLTTGGQYAGLMSQAGQPGAVASNLSGYARGDYINGGSPQFNAALDYQSGKLADDVNRAYSNMGRYGSAAHAGTVGEQVGQFRNQALSDEIAREQGLQMQAAGMLSGEQQQGWGNQLAALSGLTGTQQQNIANMLGAGAGYTGAVNQGQQLAGNYSNMGSALYNQLYSPYQMLGQAGSAYDAYNQSLLSDTVNRYNQEQQAPWNRLGALAQYALGAGSQGGTSTSSTSTPTNPMQIIGGLASTALPFFSSGLGSSATSAFNSAFNPYTASQGFIY